MATLTATGATAAVQPKFIHAGMYSITGRYTATPAVGDVIQMVKVPSGFIVHDVVVQGHYSAPSAVMGIITIGDGDDPDRFMSASISQNGISRMGLGIVSNALPYEYTVNDTIDITIGALTGSASTSHNLNIGIIVIGSIDSE